MDLFHGDNSMLSLGAAAYTENGKLIDTFYENLKPLADAHQDPSTMKFWNKYPEAWRIATLHPDSPQPVMHRYFNWLKALPGLPVLVAWPAVFDGMWIHWYLMHFIGEDPCSHSGIDIKTMASIAMKCKYRDTSKNILPKKWLENIEHDHTALTDALGQAEIFFNLKEMLEGVI